MRLRGDGGTIGLAAVDPEGMGVALIQSNFDGWGSGLFVEGIALHNRGAAFSLRRGRAHRVRARAGARRTRSRR